MNRLHALTDGVFAIGMTLLVLELHVPDASSPGELVRGLAGLGPSLFSFALSFAVLGVYWVGNAASLARQARVDRPALLLNLLQLFFISLLPFTTAILGRYPDESAAVIVYGAHLVALGLVQYIHFAYILRSPHLLEHPIAPRDAAAATRRIFFGPVMFLIAMAVALVSPRAGYAIYFFVLIVYIAISARDRSIVGR
jgi:uncharacterized membrane protein